MVFTIAKWRKKAISIFGKSRDLTKTQRARVTAATHGTVKTKKRKGGRKTASTKSKGRGGRRSTMLGTVGWKGILLGTALLAAVKYLAKRFAPIPPRYVSGAAMVGTSFIPVSGTKSLRSAGIMDLGSEFVSDLFIGGLPTVGTRGYDY